MEAKYPPILRQPGGVVPEKMKEALLKNAVHVVLSLHPVRQAANLPDDQAPAVDEFPAYQLPGKWLQGPPLCYFRESARVMHGRLDCLVAAKLPVGCENGRRQWVRQLLAVPVERLRNVMQAPGGKQGLRHPHDVLVRIGARESESVTVDERTAIDMHPAIVRQVPREPALLEPGFSRNHARVGDVGIYQRVWLAAFVVVPRVADRDIEILVLGHAYKGCVGGRVEPVVHVQKSQIAPGRMAHAYVARHGLPLIFLPDDLQSRQ